MLYGIEKQQFVSTVMSELKAIEAEFKQIKAAANLAAQQGDNAKTLELIKKLKAIVE